MTSPDSQPSSKSLGTPTSFPQVPAFNASTQELGDRIKSIASALSNLIKETEWPLECHDAAQNFQDTMDGLAELPSNTSLVKDAAEEFLRVLEAAHTDVKKASDKYGKKERGLREGFRHQISSLRPQKCSTILRTCQIDITSASTTLRRRLESVKAIDSAPSGSGQLSEASSGTQEPPTTAQSQLKVDLGPSEPLPGLQVKSGEQAGSSEDPTNQQASAPGSSSGLPEVQESRRPIREGTIIALRKTFKTADAVSGAIPGVGNFVGAAAKVGLAFVNMIEMK